MKSIFLIPIILFSSYSFAGPYPTDCLWYYHSFLGEDYMANTRLEPSRSWGTQTISRSAAIGSVVLSETQIEPTDMTLIPTSGKIATNLKCGPQAVLNASYTNGASATNINPSDYPDAAGKVYSTNVPGIGMITKLKSGVGASERNFIPLSGLSVANQISPKGTSLAVILIKTGDIQPGTHTVTGSMSLKTASWVYEKASFSFTVFVENCSIAEKGANISVPMGNITISDLKPASQSQNFRIPLTNCASGSNTSNIANVTFEPSGGSTVIDAANGILGLDISSDAKGIGVQILKENGTTAFPLNAKTPAGAITPGNTELKFYARYIKTNDNPQPGNANAKANFTVNYN